jgi:hypothetical protein
MDAQFTMSSMGQVSSARERIGCSGYSGPAVALEAMDPALLMTASPRAILFRHPKLTGLPDRVVEGDG